MQAEMYSLTALGASAMALTLVPRGHNKASLLIGEIAFAMSALLWTASWYPFELPMISVRSTYGLYEDELSYIVSMAAAFVGAMVLPLFFRRGGGNSWQFASTVLLGVAATSVLASTTNPYLILASWGLVSLASYSMVALSGDRDSLIGSIKYAFMSALSFQFLIIGVYMAMFAPVGSKIEALGVLLFLLALGFKAGIPPFHMWLPDVYGFSDPVPVSMLSSTMKLGAFALGIRLLYEVMPTLPTQLGYSIVTVLVVLSVAGMVLGNLAALTQTDVQRMMAYSSIAHVGYMTMALSVLAASAVYKVPQAGYFALLGLLVYFVSYALSKASVFSFISDVRGQGRAILSRFEGLGDTSRESSASVSIILLNLIGMPPLLGFWGKFFVFLSAANPSISIFYAVGIPWFALVGIINSAISVFYYLKVIRAIYRKSAAAASSKALGLPLASSVLLVVLGVLIPLLISL